jgi:hypothetical protein
MDRTRGTIYVNSAREVVSIEVTYHAQKKLVSFLIKRESKKMTSMSWQYLTVAEATTVADTIDFMREKNREIILEDPLVIIDVKKDGGRIKFSFRRQRGKMMRQFGFSFSDEEAIEYSKYANYVLFGEDSD